MHITNKQLEDIHSAIQNIHIRYKEVYYKELIVSTIAKIKENKCKCNTLKKLTEIE